MGSGGVAVSIPSLPVKRYDLICVCCGTGFVGRRPDKKYCCFACQARQGRRRRGEQVDIHSRRCGECDSEFTIQYPAMNRRYCSDECSTIAAKRSRRQFHKKKPYIQKLYNSRRKYKDSGVVTRLFRRFPELPKACQSCGEARVVEIAHRPDFRRNGAFRKIENSQPHMIWILCPTCHKLLDRGISTPLELGLV
jgi:hypothetical protein